ncbi:MAG: hypothetical protein DRI26_00210 [Chloroflexi bacterium]|nr:MAG: hypothetical protein DRI26_00210 [Chloroflexota bacterium]
MDESLIFSIDPEIVKELANTIADMIVNQEINLNENINMIDVNIDLDQIATSLAGVTSPIGQLKSWLRDQLNAIASWIADTVSGFVDRIISGLKNFISGLTDSLASTFKSAIGALWEKISSAIDALKQTIESIVIEPIKEMIEKAKEFVAGIPGLLSKIKDAVSGIIGSIKDAVAGIVDKISDTIRGVASKIAEIVGKVKDAVAGVIKKITEAAKGAFETIEKGVRGLIDGIKKAIDFVKEIVEKAKEALGRVATLGELLGKIKDAVADFLKYLTKLPEIAPEIVEKAATWVWERLLRPAYDYIHEHIIQPVLSAWDKIVEKVKTGFEVIERAFTGFINAVLNLPEKLWALLPESIKKAFETIKEFLEKFWNAIKEFIKDPVGALKEAFTWLAHKIWELLPDAIKDALTTIKNFLEKVWNALKEFFKDPIGAIKEAFSWLAHKIWELLPDAIKDALTTIKDFFVKLWNAIKEFIKDPVGSLKEAFSWLAHKIWELLPESVRNAFETIAHIAGEIKDAVINIAKKAWETFKDFLKDPLGAIKDIARKIFGVIADALKWVAEHAIKALEWGVGAVVNSIIKLADIAMKFARRIAEFIMSLVEKGLTTIDRELAKIFDRILSIAKEDCGEATLYVSFTVPAFLVTTTLTTIPAAIEGLAETIDRVEVGGAGEGGMRPLGVGLAGRIIAKIYANLTALSRRLAGPFKDISKEVAKDMILASTFWSFEFVRPLFRKVWTMKFYEANWDTIGFEIPTLDQCIRFAQRYYPTAYAEEMLEKVAVTIREHGYPKWVFDRIFEPVAGIWSKFFAPMAREIGEKVIITVKDRFEQDRALPCSPFFGIPTASEMCRMMVRDIFKDLASFTRAIAMHGFVPDIAYMYYLLHFKYPSPEKLWDFTCRGIAGLLWFVPPEKLKEEAEKEATDLKAYKPIPPVALNFEAKTLFRALGIYMKWHDYARFAWIDQFTSDNWIIIDTLADIPTKIDVRWMTKWGLFDFMASKKIGLKTPVAKFADILEDRAANEKVEMDLTLMCRLLQATGLHPYYVPLVAVAETINALADERTLLRTGLIHLYEYGAMSYKELDDLMANLVTASFKVAYFDIEKGEWVEERYINIPVMYLPAERKLLELRALIDRHHRIYKDVLSDIATAYREHIITEEEGINAMKEVVEHMNKLFSDASEKIVGRQLKLSVDENYMRMMFAAMQVERLVWTVRRIRYWYARIIAWMMYRLAYAYVTPEDVKRVIGLAQKAAKLTKEEAVALSTLMNEVINIAAKEYIPTPSQLATIAEIVPEARALFREVVKARRVPPEWVPVWAKYVAIKPVFDEVKSVLSDAKRLYAYFMITSKAFEEFLETIQKYGYEDYEIKLIMDEANLERWYRAYDYLIGTPRELVTMAEYSPRARELALARVYEMIDALPVDDRTKEFLKAMWEEYVRIKPVYDEVRRYVTELLSDYAEGVIDRATLEKELEDLKAWGLDDYEIEFYLMLAEKRRRRYELRKMQGLGY